MLVPLLWLLVLAVVATPLAAQSSQGGETRIFINELPEYDLMSTCAELQVSTIVRDMSDGCGDDKHTTSFACFCFSSSAHFSSVIKSKVSVNCTSDLSQTSVALSVFSIYCDEGKSRLAASVTDSGTATVSTSQTASATPAHRPATVTVVATTGSESNSNTIPKGTPVVAIVVGVCVPIGIIVVAVASFLLWTHRRAQLQSQRVELPAPDPTHEVGSREVYELKQNRVQPPPVEIDDTSRRAELDASYKRGGELPT